MPMFADARGGGVLGTDKRTDAWWDIFYDMKNRFWAVGCGLGWAVE